jgi:hypothetical protein
MLEPPRDLPREVEAAMEAEAAATNRSQARAGMFMSFGYLAFLPGLIGYRGTNLYAAGFFAYVVLNGLLMLLRARGIGPAFLHTPTAVATRNAILIGALGCVFSPYHVGPGLALVNTAALLNAPLFQRPRSVAILVIAMLAAVLVPWLGELAGLFPSTFSFTDHGTVVHTPGLTAGVAGRTAGWLVFTTVVLVVATMIAFFVQRTERQSRRRLHLYAWHLRQLVP